MIGCCDLSIQEFIAQAQEDHAERPEDVAARFEAALDLVEALALAGHALGNPDAAKARDRARDWLGGVDASQRDYCVAELAKLDALLAG